MNTFYLVSTELRNPYKQRHCVVLKKIKNNTRNDFYLVQIKPSIESYIYKTQSDINFLAIATKYNEELFVNNKDAGLDVYICHSVNLNPQSTFIEENINILDWGKVFLNETNAIDYLKSQ